MKLLLRIFKSVADKRRLEILELLAKQEKITIYEIKEKFKNFFFYSMFSFKKVRICGNYL